MKYPAIHGAPHELLNFSNEAGFVYGFVENKGDWINLENLGAKSGAPTLDGVTVIWCALDPSTRRLRVIGWYDDARAYSEPQTLKRSKIRSNWHYQFRAKAENAHLIPTAERYLEVPMKISITDKGFIGQRNWFFPEKSARYGQFSEAFGLLAVGDSTAAAPRNAVDQRSFEEGQRLIAEISISSRNPKLVASAKRHYGYRCQVCDFSFEERYGEIGKGFIEVHHLSPLSARRIKTASTIEDVRVVCANCHRMIHKKSPPFGLSEFKKLLR